MGHHEHAHAADFGRDTRRRLAIAIVINLIIVVGESIGGWLTGSVALLADAGHNLTDVGALVLALLATMLASMAPNAKRSFGYYRLEILAAFLNGLVLVAVSIFIVVESIGRLRAPPAVPGFTVLAIATIALAGNLLSAGVLLPGRDSLNVRAAFTHLLADALSSVGVIVAGALVFTGTPIADPVAGLLIAVLIVVSGYGIVREAIDVLLQATPRGLDPAKVRAEVEAMAEVRSVHDLHIWSLTSGRHVATLHVVVDPADLRRCDDIVTRVSERLHDRFAIEHTTVQLETTGLAEHVGHVHD